MFSFCSKPFRSRPQGGGDKPEIQKMMRYSGGLLFFCTIQDLAETLY
jgi:hypothetical protein